MKLKGKISNIAKNLITGTLSLTFDLSEADAGDFNTLTDKVLSIEIKHYRQGRSLDANAMLWACLNDISMALHVDKWDLYIQALRKYGQYTTIALRSDALEQFKKVYRECEVVGSRYVDGEEILEVLCYYGSSTYNSKEFSVLLDGVIDDMKQAGLETPTSAEMQRALEIWGNEQEVKKRVYG